MARRKQTNSKGGVPGGVVGAVAGTVIGGAAGVILSNKKARNFVKNGFDDAKEYAQEAYTTVSEMAGNNKTLKKQFAGIKGGISKPRSTRRRSRKSR